MKAIFDDPQMSFQMLRALGGTAGGISDVGECLSTGYRITEGDFESWYSEWNKTAERLRGFAEDCAAAGHDVSAREAYSRASNYYRLAEFYLHGTPDDPRILELYDKSKSCFEESLKRQTCPYQVVEIPYEGATLPGIFSTVDDSGTPRPTLILQTGFDGTIEELQTYAAAAVARGINCMTFEGPGQGRVIRKQGLHFRPDWEKVVTPILDFTISLPEVRQDKVALMGISFGGYLAPRACAFEHRIAACIANGGVYSFMGSKLPPGMAMEDMISYIKSDPDGFSKSMWEMADKNLDLKWGIENGMFTFGAPTAADWWLMASEYTMKDVADKITCPTLIIDSEADKSFPGEAKKLHDALTCPKTWMLFTAEEGAEEHCQIGAGYISGERIFNWLEEALADA